MDIKVFTIFPEMFPGPLALSLTGRALEKKIWNLQAVNLRGYTLDKHQSVDDTSYGGGPGMVFRPDVIDRALSHHYGGGKPGALIYFSPRGTPLKQSRVKELAQTSTLGLLCGRFEGVDQRVIDAWDIEEVSIGDFILTGGELPAMILIDACIRLLPGVIGSSDSLEEESFSKGLLEYPHYTRPSEWKGQKVPEALLSGHHEKIKAWRQTQAEEITRKRRPDLWAHYCNVFNARERADHE
jgi:tRNA (guanine37-N1)-methyltransferase